MAYPGWESAEDWVAETARCETTFNILTIIKDLIKDLYPVEETEKKFQDSLIEALDQYIDVIFTKIEITKGCYGADIYAQDHPDAEQRLIVSGLPWPEVTDKFFELNKKNPNSIYLARPHDPTKSDTDFKNWFDKLG